MIDFMTRDIYLEAASPASLEMAICLEIVLWSGVAIPGPVGQYSVHGWPHLPPVSRVTPEVQGKLFIPTLAPLFVEITKKNLVPLSSGEVFLIFCVLKLFFNWIKGLAYLHALSGLVTVPIGLAASWGAYS